MLYQASGVIRREYDMKCKLLRHKESVDDNPIKIDKIRASIKDLHSRIRVAFQRINSISKKIEEIRDKELQPQLEELIGGYDFLLSHLCDYPFTGTHRRRETSMHLNLVFSYQLWYLVLSSSLVSILSKFLMTKWCSTIILLKQFMGPCTTCI